MRCQRAHHFAGLAGDRCGAGGSIPGALLGDALVPGGSGGGALGGGSMPSCRSCCPTRSRLAVTVAQSAIVRWRLESSCVCSSWYTCGGDRCADSWFEC